MIETNVDVRAMAAYILNEMWQQRWLIVGVAWLVSLIGCAAVIALPDRFTVTARLYVDTETVLMPLMRGMAVQSDLSKMIDVMRRTLLSRPNIERLLRMTDLDLTLNSDIHREEFIAGLQRRISIDSQGTNSQLYLISFEDRDPELAQRLVQSLLTIFVEQNVGNKRRDVESAQRFINSQIKEYEERLRDAEARLAQFRQTNAEALGMRQTAASAVQTAEADVRRLETDRQALIWRRDQLRVELARTPETLTAEEASRNAGPSSPAAERVASLRTALSSLLLTKTERHPDVIATRRQLESAEAELARQSGNQRPGAPSRYANPVHTKLSDELRRLDTEIAIADRRLENARAELAQRRKQVEIVPEVEQQLSQLNRDYDILRKNYEELVSRRESARLAQSMENSTRSVDFRVVDPPVVPLTPSGPNRILFLSVVLAGALAAGASLAVLQYFIRNPLIGLDQLQEIAGLPVVGGVSQVRTLGNPHLSVLESMTLLVFTGALLSLFGGLIYAYKFASFHLDFDTLRQLAVPWLERLRQFVP